jgi:organic hydroperoxide reductase OsmC/OhrA
MATPLAVLTESPAPAVAPRYTPFPHHYEVRLEGCGTGGVMIAPPRPVILGGAPAEFAGSDQWWSPEHLLLASASLCLKATFEALARLKHMAVQGYSAAARALLDRTAEGPAFTWIRITVELTVASEDAERARALLEKSKEHCIVARSLNVPIQLEINVNGS